jgi:hypothetical protein
VSLAGLKVVKKADRTVDYLVDQMAGQTVDM